MNIRHIPCMKTHKWTNVTSDVSLRNQLYLHIPERELGNKTIEDAQ